MKQNQFHDNDFLNLYIGIVESRDDYIDSDDVLDLINALWELAELEQSHIALMLTSDSKLIRDFAKIIIKK